MSHRGKTTSWIAVLALVPAILDASSALSAEVRPQIASQWHVPEKNEAAVVVASAPNAARKELSALLHSRMAQRLANGGKALYYLFRFDQADHLRKAEEFAVDSPANVLGNLDSAVSDVASLTKAPIHPGSRESHRIEVCSVNLAAAADFKLGEHFLVPASHVGVLIDRDEKFSDPGGGGLRAEDHPMCNPVPVWDRESDSLAIERLLCVAGSNDVSDYSVLEYNCEGYTEDVLHASGMGAPLMLNLGIGGELPLGSPSSVIRQRSERAREFRSARQTCDDHVRKVASLIEAWDSGKDGMEANQSLKDYFGANAVKGSDTILQLIVSAARGKNAAAKQRVLTAYSQFDVSGAVANYYDKDGNVRKIVRPMLKAMFADLDSESMGWITTNYPMLQKLAAQVSED